MQVMDLFRRPLSSCITRIVDRIVERGSDDIMATLTNEMNVMAEHC